MARKIDVIVAETARQDLNSIAEFISQDSPRASRKMIKKISESLKKLPSFPQSGRMIPEIQDPTLREIVIGPYRIMYRLEKDKIVILRALHGKRLFEGEL